MAGYKDPGFEERVASAARAKAKALEQLRAKPPLDEAAIAQAKAAREAREAREAEKREARRLAKEAADDAKREKAAEAAAQAEAVKAEANLSEAERKALRDARYAARKNRKK